MTERRFTDKPDLAPWAVRGLAPDHPAMRENRTLFPSTVIEVTATEPDRLLVSGVNNRKLGATVTKGAFKGYALYGLSLEERATCPDDCAVRDICYGNGMQMARRHRIGDADTFFDRLGFEICELLDEHEGLLIRLHVLGDFPSAEYVAFWADALEEHEALAVYGYTHRRTTAWSGDEIGDAIEAVKERFPDRFRIRWSSDVSRSDGAVVIGNVPKTPRIAEGIVCPAQTEATACCASCGLCWEPNARNDTIVFIKHGPKSLEAAAAHAMAASAKTVSLGEPSSERQRIGELIDEGDHPDLRANPPGLRRVRAIEVGKIAALASVAPTPEARLVFPEKLLVEALYQRDLSSRSISLIRRIVNGWDWAKFKPPICAEGPDGLFVIDGQHTAIAAATRGIRQIPVLIVSAKEVEKRAAAFVSHNRDRLVMSPLQVFHAEVTAGDETSRRVLEIATAAGATIPRAEPAKGNAKPGQLIPVRELRRALVSHGDEVVRRVVSIAVAAEVTPLTQTACAGLITVLTAPPYKDVARLKDSAIANALKSWGNIDVRAREAAATMGVSHWRAAASMIADVARAALEPAVA